MDLTKKNKPFSTLKRHRYDTVIKERIVRGMFQAGCSASEWSKRCGISERNLKRWIVGYPRKLNAVKMPWIEQTRVKFSCSNRASNQRIFHQQQEQRQNSFFSSKEICNGRHINQTTQLSSPFLYSILQPSRPNCVSYNNRTSTTVGGMTNGQYINNYDNRMDPFGSNSHNIGSYDRSSTFDKEIKLRDDDIWGMKPLRPIFPYFKSTLHESDNESKFDPGSSAIHDEMNRAHHNSRAFVYAWED